MSYELGYATARAEARDWPAPRIRNCLRRRWERLETLCRYEAGRRDWLEDEAGKVDALTDLLAAASAEIPAVAASGSN
ncbi:MULTISPECIES: hypothetical protein [unclassified Xanthobacter]|uniref:hypothetical protein n=1 Tax=unclassified Xanthobacter TaxID=2623496 RepID=UPI001F24657C|nr:MULTISPECIES: hypothetical protein [unclassified Xanthobacter]